MQTLQEIIALTSADRITNLRIQVQSHDCTRKTASKFLLAMIKAGDCAANEINAYSKKHLGFDIRKDVQGVYQSLKVLESIINGEMPGVDEADFDRNSWTTNQEMSKFLNPDNPLFLNREEAINAYKSDNPIKALKAIANANKPKATKDTEEATPQQTAPIAINFGNVIDWLKNHVETQSICDLAGIQESLYKLIVTAQARIEADAPTVDVETIASVESAAA